MALTEREKEYIRTRRRITNNAATKKYEKTKNGFLMRAYRNMQSRVTGIQAKKFHLYQGLDILPRSDFYNWSKLNNSFHRLFDEWEASGYDRRLTPSVNRIDPNMGYKIENMEWITHSENSRKTRRWVH